MLNYYQDYETRGNIYFGLYFTVCMCSEPTSLFLPVHGWSLR